MRPLKWIGLFLVVGFLNLIGCGGGGGGGTPALPPAPVITSFAVAKSPLTAGTSTTLTAVFSNGTGSVDQGVGSITSGVPVSITPNADTTYTLTVTGSGGTATRTVTVSVVAAPVITSLSAAKSPLTVDSFQRRAVQAGPEAVKAVATELRKAAPAQLYAWDKAILDAEALEVSLGQKSPLNFLDIFTSFQRTIAASLALAQEAKRA